MIQVLPLPETPRWLIEHGRTTDGSRILAALRSKDSTPDDDEIVYQRRAIETALELESAGGPFQYKELLRGGKLQNLRRMILCGMVNLMQQFTGKLRRERDQPPNA